METFVLEASKPVTRCSVCGRPLSDPASVAAGVGPVCGGKTAKCADDHNKHAQDITVYGVWMWREDREARTNVAHVVKHHSPTGFDWGYSGSGPSDLALNILHQFLPPDKNQDNDNVEMSGVTISGPTAYLYQAFKREVIGIVLDHGGHLPPSQIRRWLAERLPRLYPYPFTLPPCAAGPAPGSLSGQTRRTTRPGLPQNGDSEHAGGSQP